MLLFQLFQVHKYIYLYRIVHLEQTHKQTHTLVTYMEPIVSFIFSFDHLPNVQMTFCAILILRRETQFPIHTF